MTTKAPHVLLDLDFVRIDAALALRVPAALALRRRILPFGADERGVHAACADPSDHAAVEALERVLGRPVVAVAAEPAALERALARVFIRRDAPAADEAVAFVDELLHAALVEQASDIHVEPGETEVVVRFRIDGCIERARTLPTTQFSSVLNRIKVMAGMDIAERRLPQDGRFTFRYGPPGAERTVDVRAAALPTRFGERFTLRLLATERERIALPRLGLESEDLATLAAALEAPHGLVLLTGPTGCGKTTTLYAAMQSIDLGALNVLSIEDPVEYDLPGVSQVEVDPGNRVTFASALRSALRHDPDVLMIGEVRDLETAEIVIRSSLTGHLVLSTLHTNSAVAAVTRLVDMGVPAYLVAATLRLVVAQRLVRRLCVRCRVERALRPEEAAALGASALAGSPAFDARGCPHCRGSGYAGRLGLFECFAPGAAAAAAIVRGATEPELLDAVSGARERTLSRDASRKIAAGLTSPAEALQAVEAA